MNTSTLRPMVAMTLAACLAACGPAKPPIGSPDTPPTADAPVLAGSGPNNGGDSSSPNSTNGAPYGSALGRSAVPGASSPITGGDVVVLPQGTGAAAVSAGASRVPPGADIRNNPGGMGTGAPQAPAPTASN